VSSPSSVGFSTTVWLSPCLVLGSGPFVSIVVGLLVMVVDDDVE